MGRVERRAATRRATGTGNAPLAGPHAGSPPWLVMRGIAAAGLVLALVLALGGSGCVHYATGRYHTIAPGENLYRIGLKYGVDADTVAKANGIDDVTALRVGQRIWIPKPTQGPSSARASAQSSRRSSSGGAGDPKAAARARDAARREATRNTGLDFIWPVKATTLTSRFGRRNGRPHEGIDIRARKGTRIRAAESGKVIHSGWLGDYGKVVIIKHPGQYRSVYAHASKLHVRRGQFVDRGQRIAEVGTTGKSTGPHLHFEIRRGESPRDPMLYLP